MRPLFVLSLAMACGPPSDSDCVHSFYVDGDGDGHGVPEATLTGCVAPPGYETTHDDCDDRNNAIHPGAEEQCNGIDDDCDGATDPARTYYADLDHDGYGNNDETSCYPPNSPSATVGGDCDDSEATVHPGADEICNGIDDDCDEAVDIDAIDMSTSYTDADGDGYGDDATASTSCDVPATSALVGGDCDDDDPSAVNAEVWYADLDGDRHGDPTTGTLECASPEGSTADGTDCDDTAPSVHPDADEICNAIDDDCDGLTDDDDSSVTGRTVFYVDDDGDGLGTLPSVVLCFAPTAYADAHGDCDDSDASVGVPTTLYRDADGDGYGGDADDRCATAGWTLTGGDCDDTRSDVFPGAAEVCDDVDDDCDGLVDADDSPIEWPTFYADTDADGYGDDAIATVPKSCDPPSGYVAYDGDCKDDDVWIHPGATEYCDALDNDCDGTSDDDVVYTTWYADDDADGYGDQDDDVSTCERTEGRALDAGDCDDTAATTHPGAVEVCINGVDEDCDGVTDACAVNLEDADWSLVGPMTYDVSTLGYEVLAADLNADGVADLIAGAPEIDPSVYVFFGPLSGSSALDEADLTIDSIGLGDVMSAADADADDDTDLLLGAPDDHAAYLFLGPVTSDPTSADAELLAPAHGPSATVARIVPDYDGDGVAEVAINAMDLTAGASEGSLYLAPATTTGRVSLPRNATYTYEGASYELGATAAVGDTTGDGIDDLAVGATGRGRRETAVFVLAGGEKAGSYEISDAAVATLTSVLDDGFGAAIDATDADADGYADLFVGAPTSGASVYGFRGPFATERDTDPADTRWVGEAGLGFSVAAGGDIDADGLPDVLLGATVPDKGRGFAYLQLGPAEGVVDVDELLSFERGPGSDVGYSVAFVPDWAGDGRPEIALGAPYVSDGLTGGESHVDVVFSESLF